MKLRQLGVLGSTVSFLALGAVPAGAGGLYLPGSGAVSTSRAGAAIASTDDGEALGLNPAGLAKSRGTTITVSAAIISYMMEFTRRGTYDPIEGEDRPYEGQPFPTVRNDVDLPLGIGSFQPVPVVAVVSDLGGAVPNLTVAAGLYAPNAYPFRNMRNGYTFNEDLNAPPPPTRYDILEQEALLAFPSIAASYRILPELDVGARFSYGFAHLKSSLGIWGTPGNYQEAVTSDAEFTADVRDNFVPAWGLGVTYRPLPQVELAATYTSRAVIRGRGSAHATKGPGVEFNGQEALIGPVPDDAVRCAPGGTFEEQKICVDLQIPQTAMVGARYKFLRPDGGMRADVELNVGWENWGKRCETAADFASGCTSPAQYRVVTDAAAYVVVDGQPELAVTLKDAVIDHRFKDTYTFRLGGSYHLPLGDATAPAARTLILRGGVAYDTRAAEEGWLRVDIDGAARTTTTIGAAYRTPSWELSVGGGAILEGTMENAGTCNPTPMQGMPSPGCGPGGTEQSVDDRRGPDPINPIVTATQQAESPINQGTLTSNYVLLMLGFTTWF